VDGEYMKVPPPAGVTSWRPDRLEEQVRALGDFFMVEEAWGVLEAPHGYDPNRLCARPLGGSGWPCDERLAMVRHLALDAITAQGSIFIPKWRMEAEKAVRAYRHNQTPEEREAKEAREKRRAEARARRAKADDLVDRLLRRGQYIGREPYSAQELERFVEEARGISDE
jgi:hypothetical protein